MYCFSFPIFLNSKVQSGLIYRLNGVGFKSFVSSFLCLFQLGYSHYLVLTIPFLTIVRSSKQTIALQVSEGNFFRQVENLRKPDAYKARGIHLYENKPTTKEGKRR